MLSSPKKLFGNCILSGGVEFASLLISVVKKGGVEVQKEDVAITTQL